MVTDIQTVLLTYIYSKCSIDICVHDVFFRISAIGTIENSLHHRPTQYLGFICCKTVAYASGRISTENI